MKLPNNLWGAGALTIFWLVGYKVGIRHEPIEDLIYGIIIGINISIGWIEILYKMHQNHDNS